MSIHEQHEQANKDSQPKEDISEVSEQKQFRKAQEKFIKEKMKGKKDWKPPPEKRKPKEPAAFVDAPVHPVNKGQPYGAWKAVESRYFHSFKRQLTMIKIVRYWYTI